MSGTKSRAAAALVVEAERAVSGLHELMDQVRGCFARIEPWVQARGYVRAVSSNLPERNGWTIAEWIGDRTPDKTRRLLNHAVWDTDGLIRTA